MKLLNILCLLFIFFSLYSQPFITDTSLSNQNNWIAIPDSLVFVDNCGHTFYSKHNMLIHFPNIDFVWWMYTKEVKADSNISYDKLYISYAQDTLNPCDTMHIFTDVFYEHDVDSLQGLDIVLNFRLSVYFVERYIKLLDYTIWDDGGKTLSQSKWFEKSDTSFYFIENINSFYHLTDSVKIKKLDF